MELNRLTALIDGAERKRKTAREWYQKNKKRRADRDRLRYQKRKLELVQKLGGACMRCGGQFPSCVYDFHHDKGREGTYEVPSKSIANGRLTEVEGLILLCANCHRLEHHDNSIN